MEPQISRPGCARYRYMAANAGFHVLDEERLRRPQEINKELLQIHLIRESELAISAFARTVCVTNDSVATSM
eukprot:scaffold434134_cov17-Prasinocladus_malaysianus.AAC.1